MIEIPKYSIGTYDPDSLAINQRTDFTRRIPTGLSDRQMARADKLCRQLINIQEDGRGAKAKGRVVKSRQVMREEVFAYISRRGEEEIIIL